MSVPPTRPVPFRSETPEGDVLRDEDPDRVKRATESALTPEEYRRALRETGMADHLRNAATEKYLTNAWTRTGPVGGFGNPRSNGRISNVEVIAEPDGYSVYAGACQGGLWVTHGSDLGSWTDIGANLPNPSVRAFAVDPDNHDRIFVGTGDFQRYSGSGMYVTENGGLSWDLIDLDSVLGWTPPYFFRIIFLGNAADPGQQKMVAACYGGILHSSDNGLTWHLGKDASGDDLEHFWTDVVVHPDIPTLLYAVRFTYSDVEPAGFFRSFNSGVNWQHIDDSDFPPSSDWYRASLAICENSPDNLALMVTNHSSSLQGIFKSIDSGLNWSDITGSMPTDPAFRGNQVGHAQTIAIRPDDPNQIFVGAVDLVMTTNGGFTWASGEEETGIPQGHVDLTRLYFTPIHGNNFMWICNDGGIYYHSFTTDTTLDVLGNTTTGLACSEIDFLSADRQVRIIGLQDNGIVRSVNGAATWEYITGGDGAAVQIFDPEDGDTFYNNGVYAAPEAWKTFRLNYGEDPLYVHNPDDVYMPRIYYSPLNEKLYTHDQTAIYSMPAEGPDTWTFLKNNLQPDVYSIREIASSRSRDEALWVLYWANDSVNHDDLTLVYNNGGGWEVNHFESLNTNNEAITCVMASREWPGEAWVGMRNLVGSQKILHTTDYGETWEDLTSNLASLNEILTIQVMPFKPWIVYVGTDLGVFRTTNGGASWSPFMEGLPIGRCSKMELIIDPAHTGNHTLVLAMDGRGTWSRDLVSTPIVFVDKRNNGMENGSFEHPYNTVTEGIAAADSEGTVAIHSETYYEPQMLTADVHLVSWGGSSVIR